MKLVISLRKIKKRTLLINLHNIFSVLTRRRENAIQAKSSNILTSVVLKRGKRWRNDNCRRNFEIKLKRCE